MGESVTGLDEIAKKAGMDANTCPVCGGIPALVVSTDEQGWSSCVVKCRCGLKKAVGGAYAGEIVDEWNRISETEYRPSDKPWHVGIPCVCATCLMRGRCVECRKLESPWEFSCGDWTGEVRKEC